VQKSQGQQLEGNQKKILVSLLFCCFNNQALLTRCKFKPSYFFADLLAVDTKVLSDRDKHDHSTLEQKVSRVQVRKKPMKTTLHEGACQNPKTWSCAAQSIPNAQTEPQQTTLKLSLIGV
jgi:hypothetical protein